MNRGNKRNVGKQKKIRMIMAGFVASTVITTNITTATVLAYDRKKAVEYADTHWSNYSSDYESFKSDCTNYASQVLRAGGYSENPIPSEDVGYADMNDERDVYKTKKYWCNKIYTKEYAGIITVSEFVTTSTWCNVDMLAGSKFYGLQDYMVNKLGKTRHVWGISEETIDKLAEKAKKGDIIQIARENSRFSHTYIVGKVKKGKVYVYAHTGNRDASSDDELQEMRENGAFTDYTLIALIKA